jgi:hypothetical protein
MAVISGIFVPTIFNPSPYLSSVPVFFTLISVVLYIFVLGSSIAYGINSRKWILLFTGFIPILNAYVLVSKGGLESYFWRIAFWVYFVFCIAPVAAFLIIIVIAR